MTYGVPESLPVAGHDRINKVKVCNTGQLERVVKSARDWEPS